METIIINGVLSKSVSIEEENIPGKAISMNSRFMEEL